jgi:Ras-related protein Rab-5C
MSKKSLKLVVVGPTCAGKTSITNSYQTGVFSETVETTVGSGYSSVQYESATHGTTVRAEIWDTAGQERHRSLAPFYLRNAAGALLVFEKGDRESFEQCVQVWLPDLLPSMKGSSEFVVLVANKTDLGKPADAELQARVDALVAERGMAYFETSAKTGDNVNEMFAALIEKILAAKAAAASVPGSARASEEPPAKEPVDLKAQPAASGGGCPC